MIYSLIKSDVSDADRLVIAKAIYNSDVSVIENHALNGNIVHIMDAASDEGLTCVFCRILVFATDARAPHGLEAVRTWHFEHRRTGYLPGQCVGHVRRAPIPDALGVENPAQHGCYICMGCETAVYGNATDWHRTACKTIDRSRTYCHLATTHGCI